MERGAARHSRSACRRRASAGCGVPSSCSLRSRSSPAPSPVRPARRCSTPSARQWGSSARSRRSSRCRLRDGCSSSRRDGVWVVQADGSKRRLGGWREASWSPFGRFVVVARANELAALEPDGDVRWSLARPRVRFPRWAGDRIDTRIAYVSGRSLRVVAGDGTGDRLLRRNVASVAPAWLPGEGFRLAYTDRAGAHGRRRCGHGPGPPPAAPAR